jgi:hypothetical protein
MAGNEVGRARISMMVRSMSSNTRPDTLVQDRRLQPHDFCCNARRVHTFGSFASERHAHDEFATSGVSPIAPELVHCGERALTADSVAKRFCTSEHATLIQDQASIRNLDSRIRPFRFDCCAQTGPHRLLQQYLPRADITRRPSRRPRSLLH